MSNEEFERRMEFIIEQQAQFASDMQQLREAQAHTEQVLSQTGEVVAQTVEVVARTSDVVSQTVEAMAQSSDVVLRLAQGTFERFEDVDAKINVLVDSQIRTDENLQSLIAVVDRYFSGGRDDRRM